MQLLQVSRSFLRRMTRLLCDQPLQYLLLLNFVFFLVWSRSTLIQRRASFDCTRFLHWFNPKKVHFLNFSYDDVTLTDSSGIAIATPLSGSQSGFNFTVRGDSVPLLIVQFTTDVSDTDRGFLAQYSISLGE